MDSPPTPNDAPDLPPDTTDLTDSPPGIVSPPSADSPPGTPRAGAAPFVCGCDERFRGDCEGEPRYGMKDEVAYCIFHYPGGEKSEEFQVALMRRLNSGKSSCRGFWFPDTFNLLSFAFNDKADFSYCRFGDRVYFGSVVFKAEALFIRARFESRATFAQCTFHDAADFRRARFEEVGFSHNTFAGYTVRFDSARFGGAAYFHTDFGADVAFDSARFKGDASFITAFKKGASFSRTKFRAAAALGKMYEGQSNFYRTTFYREVNFTSAEFSLEADFTSTRFHGRTNFIRTRFPAGADFSLVKFNAPVDFGSANFGPDVMFYNVEFRDEASFSSAEFGGDLRFNGATFRAGADFGHVDFKGKAVFSSFRFRSWGTFTGATFRDSLKFIGDRDFDEFNHGAALNFRYADFEKGEQVSFEYVSLRPSTFLGTDPRKFDFSGVKWHNLKARTYKVVSEFVHLRDLYPREPLASHLKRTCRYLALNAETNHRYAEASTFRYWSMEAARLGSALGFNVFSFTWWYWLASGYGEKIGRAFVVLLVLWFGFAYVYSEADCLRLPLTDRVGCIAWSTKRADGAGSVPLANEAQAAAGPQAERMDFKRATLYSLGVMSLQKPDDPAPASWLTTALVMLEAILGPVQLALLALAVRRQFML